MFDTRFNTSSDSTFLGDHHIVFDDIIDKSERVALSSPHRHNSEGQGMATPEACFVNMLWCGILALQLLPENTSAGRPCLFTLMARLPTIFVIYFTFTLPQGIFDQVPCFSSLNPSFTTYGVTGLFLQLHHASGTLYHLILDLVLVPQNSNLFSKVLLCHRFSMTYFVVSVFSLFCFVFRFYCPLNTQQNGYVRITSLIIIIFHYFGC